jgi:hypothetical protein
VEEGVVDFACFDAEHDRHIDLLLAKKRMVGGPGVGSGFANPVVMVANYVFDSLRHDAFRWGRVGADDSTPNNSNINSNSGSGSYSAPLELQEGLLTLTSERAWEPDLRDPALLMRCRHRWRYGHAQQLSAKLT